MREAAAAFFVYRSFSLIHPRSRTHTHRFPLSQLQAQEAALLALATLLVKLLIAQDDPFIGMYVPSTSPLCSPLMKPCNRPTETSKQTKNDDLCIEAAHITASHAYSSDI